MFGQLANIRPDPESPVAVRVEPYKPNRSDCQNRFLWGWVYKNLAEQLAAAGIVIPCDDGTEIPYTSEVLHEWVFGKKYRVQAEHTIKGRTQYQFESTAKMNKARFSEYIQQVRDFAFQYWGITIPEPTDRYWSAMLEELK